VRPDIRWHPRAIAAGIRGRVRALFSRDAVETDLNEELRFHLDMEIEKNVKAGMSPADARRAAHIALGGVDRTVEAHRDARGSRFLEDLSGDLRYAARALGRTPGFVAVSILTLAVAIAVGTLGFTAANGFFYRPLPVPDGENLLSISTSDFSRRDPVGGATSYPDILDFARDADSIADIAGESRTMMTIAVGDEVAYAQGAIVTGKYFRVARVRPAVGLFPAGADIPAIVISHMLWRSRFGADTSIVGKTVRVNGQPFVLAGVAPPEFRGINRENGVDFWMDGTFTPLVLLRDEIIQRRGYRSFRAIGRLKQGQSLEVLNSRLTLTADRLFALDPRAWRDTTGQVRLVTAMPEKEAHVANVPRSEKLLLMAGVIGFGLGLVVIACTNLASMQLARGASRRREIATRLALGAGRGRLIRQLLAECGLVAVPGIVVGVGLAMIVSALMLHYRPIPLPSVDLTIDWRALVYIAGSLVVTLFVFGLVPALQTVRADVLTDLKGGEQPGPGGLRIGGVRGGLIIAQVAMSMTFTAYAGLVTLSLVRHANEGRGDAGKLLISRVNFLPAAGDSSQVDIMLTELMNAIRDIPGVEGVSAALRIPLRGTRMTTWAEIESANGVRRQRDLDLNYVRAGYLGLVGIPLVRGRDFAPDERERSRVAIVSQSMAEALWPGENPLGKRMKFDKNEAPSEIIGVAADPEGFEPATDRSYPGMLYRPMDTHSEEELVLHIRAPGGQDAIAEQIVQVARRYNTKLVAPKPITLDAYYDSMMLPMRLIAQGSGALATFQFLLAVAGLSGLVGYVTELRRREIGIRTALGASRTSVVHLVMKQGVRLTLIGAAIGLAAGGMIGRGIGGSLPITPATLAGGLLISAVAFAFVGTLAMMLPALRALKVMPATALRVD
jgi:predicted permease